jgi:Zn-dependent peptidase ImmA (M78 family)
VKINYIRESIRRVVNCYGTSNPEELIHAMGIKLGYLPNDTDIDKLKGCYGMVDGEKVILIHPDLDDMERKVVCAHELNHAILHPTTNALFLTTYTFVRLGTLELEADIGASELLVSDEICYKYYGMECKQIAYIENLPLRYVELKMKNFIKRNKKVLKPMY